MKAIYKLVSLAVLLVLPVASSVFAQDTAKKNPVPDDNAQAESTKLIKEVYGDEYAKAKTSAEKQALAKKLLGKANESKSDPASQFVLLKLARDIATQASDGKLAFQAIDAMDETFQVDVLEMKAAVLTKFTSTAQKIAQHKSIAEEALKLIDEATATDNFIVADQLGTLALAEARKSREKELTTQAEGRVSEVAELVKAYEKVKEALAQLKNEPTDPQANLVVGKYLCFVKGDWKNGLPKLALVNNEALKVLAKKDAKGAVSSDEQAKLGDSWWDLAEKEDGTAKRHMQERAGHWYQQALPGLSGLAKDKVAKRMREVDMSQLLQNVLPKGKWGDLLQLVDVKRDSINGVWTTNRNGVTSASKAFLTLPATIDGDYDLQVDFTRNSGDDTVFIGLPVGSHVLTLSIAGFHNKTSSLAMIDGQETHPEATRQDGSLLNGKRYSVLVAVRSKDDIVDVRVSLNARPYLHWSGKEASIGIPLQWWPLPNSGRPAFGSTAPTTLHAASIRVVSGKTVLVTTAKSGGDPGK